MNTIKVTKKNCLFVAHRGCSGLEKENTNAAFVAAGNRSYFGIETDIHQTIDGKYVLFHDDNTKRVGVDNMIVEESTYDTLRSIILTDKDGVRGRTDLRMPSLEEYIGICKKYEKVAVLELKNAFDKEHIYEICDIIDSLGYLDQTIFISFCFDNMVAVREKYPDQRAQFLTSTFTDDLIDRLKAYNLDLDINYKALTADNVKQIKAAGIFLNCWTVDDPAIATNLINWGVDFITTNILE